MNTSHEFNSQYQNFSIKIASILLIISISAILLQNYDTVFSQTGNIPGLNYGSNNMTIPNSIGPNTGLGSSQEQPFGFVSNGKINTVINVPNGKWLATGNWSITVNNGNVTSFETKMIWYNSSGTNAHTHDIANFRSYSNMPGNLQMTPITTNDKQTIIKGFTDVGSNGKLSWTEVPTVITINDRKIISISVDDPKTNHHFGGQPLLGIADVFTPCSDQPGPNMELLPSCTETTSFPPSAQFMSPGTFPNQNLSDQGFPDQGFPDQSQQGGFPDQGFPDQSQQGGFPDQGFPDQGFPDQSQQGGFPDQGFPNDEGTNGGFTPKLPEFGDETGDQSRPDGETGDQSQPNENQSAKDQINPDCNQLDIENITASGFESDPSDYHPPSDAIDGSKSTWWSNNGDKPWIEIVLSDSHPICGIAVDWNKGDQRKYSFQIEVSEDGNNFDKIFEGSNNKGSSVQETYPFKQVISGKYVKLTVTNTSSKDGWASIKEITALGLINH